MEGGRELAVQVSGNLGSMRRTTWVWLLITAHAYNPTAKLSASISSRCSIQPRRWSKQRPVTGSSPQSQARLSAFLAERITEESLGDGNFGGA